MRAASMTPSLKRRGFSAGGGGGIETAGPKLLPSGTRPPGPEPPPGMSDLNEGRFHDAFTQAPRLFRRWRRRNRNRWTEITSVRNETSGTGATAWDVGRAETGIRINPWRFVRGWLLHLRRNARRLHHYFVDLGRAVLTS